MIKFDPKEYMTTEEATERFYPYSVVMVQCEVDHYLPIAGYVIAAEKTEDDYDELKAYEIKFQKDKANGEVYLIRTSSPMEGESIYVEDIFEQA